MHCLAISEIMAIQIDPYMHIYMHVLINATDYTCIYMITKESELHHSIGSPIDGAHPGPKTDRDYLGRYCP